jgi:hypothetical protein
MTSLIGIHSKGVAISARIDITYAKTPQNFNPKFRKDGFRTRLFAPRASSALPLTFLLWWVQQDQKRAWAHHSEYPLVCVTSQFGGRKEKGGSHNVVASFNDRSDFSRSHLAPPSFPLRLRTLSHLRAFPEADLIPCLQQCCIRA